MGGIFTRKKVSFWLSFTFQISDAKSSWVAAHQKSITISSCLSAITSKASNRKISLEKIAQPFTPGKSRESRDRLALKLILMMREAPLHVSQKKNKKLKYSSEWTLIMILTKWMGVNSVIWNRRIELINFREKTHFQLVTPQTPKMGCSGWVQRARTTQSWFKGCPPQWLPSAPNFKISRRLSAFCYHNNFMTLKKIQIHRTINNVVPGNWIFLCNLDMNAWRENFFVYILHIVLLSLLCNCSSDHKW